MKSLLCVVLIAFVAQGETYQRSRGLSELTKYLDLVFAQCQRRTDRI